ATPKTLTRLLLRCVALASLVVIPAILADAQRGWEWRLSAEKNEILRSQRFGYSPCTANGHCVFGAPGQKLGLQILGDSHAQHWVAAFDWLLTARGLRGESFTVGGCPMLIGVERAADSARCRFERESALEIIRNSTVPVVIGVAWGAYDDARLTNARS